MAPDAVRFAVVSYGLDAQFRVVPGSVMTLLMPGTNDEFSDADFQACAASYMHRWQPDQVVIRAAGGADEETVNQVQELLCGLVPVVQLERGVE